MGNGKKYGHVMTIAVPEPLDGQLISDTVASDGPNQWLPLSATSRRIEGVVVKALAANTGTVYITGAEGNQDGFPLAKGETVSVATDDLTKVKVWAPTSGDGVAFLAIEQARG
jgi:hypothetical protein